MGISGSNVRRISIGWLILLVIAGLPFLASLGFCSIERQGHPVSDSIERPALVFDQYLVNLGEIHNTARAEAHFRFKNCGQFSVRIATVEPSCSCLAPRIDTQRSYAPGEISDFALTVLTTHQTPGPHEYVLTLHYQDPQPRIVTVAFKLIIRREVTLSPSQLIIYQNGVSETEQKVVLTDMRPKPFRVTSATCKSSLVKVDLGKALDDPEGGREWKIVIHVAAEVPPVGEDCSVTLTTDDPHYPRIPIPLRIRDVRARVTRPSADGARADAASGTAH
jgi:hypothetical protein